MFLFLALPVLITSCGVVSPFGERTERTPERDQPRSEAPALEVESFSPGDTIQRGVSSWYGPNFQGMVTANGEVFEMNDLTAAHRTLPFNTVVRVTNVANGRSVDVRINDRGPYIGERVIDLSRAAAEEIDMIQAGLQEVELQLLEVGDRAVTPHNSSSQETFTVQIASFGELNQAVAESAKHDGSEVVSVSIGGTTVHRVYFGEYLRPEDAERQLRWLRNRGVDGFVKQREN